MARVVAIAARVFRCKPGLGASVVPRFVRHLLNAAATITLLALGSRAGLAAAEPAPFAADPGPAAADSMLGQAHAQGFEVDAWISCLLVWSAAQPPHDLRHVVNSHPEWIARLRDGRKLNDLGVRERERRGVEGVFLSAAHPGVRAWVASV